MSAAAAPAAPEVIERRARTMGSELHLLLVGASEQDADRAVDLLDHLERRWSRFLPDSDVTLLNRSPRRPVEVDPSTLTLVEHMVDGWVTSAGRYDPTVLPALLDAGYVSSVQDPSARTPAPATGDPAPWRLLDVELDHDRCTVTLPRGVSLDPGGIGKGLAADLVVEALLADGVAGALVSIGGDLRAEGRPPDPHGWTVKVEDPFDRGTTLLVLSLDHGGVCTSSTRSRRWVHQGVDHHHLVDPRTRRDATTDLVAVTVVAPTAAQAEVRSTAALLAGNEAATSELEDACLPAVLTTTDGSTTVTSDLDEPVRSGGPTEEAA